jgi:hypothetical protein
MLTGLLAFASAAIARPTTCGFIRASVPYTPHGRHDGWRVYKTGKTSCATANRALYAVMHLNASMHVGSSNATSYFTYHGWRCDLGQMGGQWCGMPSHRPYRAQALALDCATARCPARVPSSYFAA